jgi:GT2 family glycosyltransferase
VSHSRPSVAGVVVAIGALGSLLVTTHTLINLRRLRTPPAAPSVAKQRISVLIPARDEAAHIGACLQSVRQQTGLSELEILVLDDQSSDNTAQLVARHLEDDRIRLITGAGEPPPGWLGKTWACQRLAEQATGDILAFIDADVVLQPDALCASVAMLHSEQSADASTLRHRDHSIDAVSPYPRQVALSVPERLVQPLLQWSWLSFLPLQAAENSTRESLTAANGQFLVITSEAYQTVGGHATVGDKVLEDVELFRALKRRGRRGVIVDGTSLATCRMYTNWQEVRDGYSKSLWAAFGSKPGAAASCAMLCVLYVLPPAAMLKGSRVGAIGYLAAVSGRIAVGRRVHAQVWPDAFAHPISITALTYLTALSWFRRSRGELQWKGRFLIAAQRSETT